MTMGDIISRRRRRSMFLIKDTLLGLAMSAKTQDGQPVPLAGVKGFLLAAGVGAAVGAAFWSFRKPDGLEELPGTLERMANDETKGPVSDSKAVSNKLKNYPNDGMPLVKPVAEEKGFWTRAKESISSSSRKVSEPTVAPTTGATTPSVAPVGSVARGAAVGTAASGLTKLPAKFRTKFAFEGFKGSEGISRDGSYTAAEAQQIVLLKRENAKTSGFSKIPEGIHDKIVSYATKHGVDPGLALKMARIESGGNPNAISSTGAIGIYQFTGSTATEMGISNRFDEDQNIEGGILLIQKSVKGLPSDISPTAVNLYMYHQLGAGGAPELIRGARDGKRISDLSPRLQKQLGVNIGAGSATAAGYLESNRVALEGRPVTVAKADPSKSVPVPASMVVPVRATEKDAPRHSLSEPTQQSLDSPDPGSWQHTKPQTVIKTKNRILIGA